MNWRQHVFQFSRCLLFGGLSSWALLLSFCGNNFCHLEYPDTISSGCRQLREAPSASVVGFTRCGSALGRVQEDDGLWRHRLCLEHASWSAVIASPGGQHLEKLWSVHSTFVVSEATGGSLETLLGDSFYQCPEVGMAANSTFRNSVQREARTSRVPTLVMAARGGDLALRRSATVSSRGMFQESPVGTHWLALEITTSFRS